MTTKPDSDTVNEIHVSDADSIMTIGEDDESIGSRNLSDILESSGMDDICGSDDED